MKLNNEERTVVVFAVVLLLCSIALGGYAFWLSQDAPTLTLQLSEILK